MKAYGLFTEYRMRHGRLAENSIPCGLLPTLTTFTDHKIRMGKSGARCHFSRGFTIFTEYRMRLGRFT